jgi:multidrug efflux pump subunit AcrA (membrane-fusion protein)
MFFIYRLFNNFYSKYFPDFGFILLLVTLYYVFRKRVRTMIRVSKLFYLDKKDLLKSRRSHVPIAAAAGILILILAVPWTHRTIASQTVLRPQSEVTVQSPEDGVVAEVLVREGDRVAAGQPLFRVSSPAIDAEAERSRFESELFNKKTGGNRAASNPAMAYQSEARAAAAQTALETAETRQGFLVVRSPIAGRVLRDQRFRAGPDRRLPEDESGGSRFGAPPRVPEVRLARGCPDPDAAHEELERLDRLDLTGDDRPAGDGQGRDGATAALFRPRPLRRGGGLR